MRLSRTFSTQLVLKKTPPLVFCIVGLKGSLKDHVPRILEHDINVDTALRRKKNPTIRKYLRALSSIAGQRGLVKYGYFREESNLALFVKLLLFVTDRHVWRLRIKATRGKVEIEYQGNTRQVVENQGCGEGLWRGSL